MVYVESLLPDTKGSTALNASYELSAKLVPEFEVEQRNVVRIFGKKRDKPLIERSLEPSRALRGLARTSLSGFERWHN